MEFTTITKRVADLTGLDANAIEADPRFVGPGGWRGRNGEAATVAVAAAPAAGRAVARRRGPPRPPQPSRRARRRRFAAARAAEARATPFDLAAYQTVSDAATLQDWIGRAYEAGVVAFDTETTSLDPLQADLVGVSLAVAPGEACYIPLGHRAGEGDLFEGGGLVAGQIG